MIANDGTPARGAGFPNDVFDLLSHEYCRRVLALLADPDPQAARNLSSDWVVDEVDDRDLVEMGRYYNCLSRLAEMGVIQWDRETDTIARGPCFDDLAQLLTCTGSRRSRPESDRETDSSLEEMFDALRHPFRRHILLTLDDHSSRSTGESGPPRFSVDCDEPDILELELRRIHLDMLDEYGFVDWDPEVESLTRGENFDDIVPLLEAIRETTRDVE